MLSKNPQCKISVIYIVFSFIYALFLKFLNDLNNGAYIYNNVFILAIMILILA
jgi:hypothetical protein